MRVPITTFAVAFLLTACGSEPEFVTRCKRNVELRLASPGTAKYGSIRDVAPNPDSATLQMLDHFGYVKTPSGHVWIAYVDSQTAMGGSVRNYIACVEDRDGFSLEVKPGIGALESMIN